MSHLSFLPFSNSDIDPHAFLGFNRKKEDKKEFWEGIVHFVFIQVFDSLKERYHLCLCSPITLLDSKNIEVISQNFEIAQDQKLLDQKVKTTNKSKIIEKIKNLSPLLVVNRNEREALKNCSQKSYQHCTCYLDPIHFVSNDKQVGVILKKLVSPQTKESLDMALAPIDKKYSSLERSYLQEMTDKIKKFSSILVVNKKEAIDVATMHRREAAINQLAVEKLCEFSVKTGMKKAIVLSEIQKVKEGGYLLSKNFDALQQTIVQL